MSRLNADGQEKGKGKRVPRGEWPDGIDPRNFATGQLTLRTIFPEPYGEDVTTRRPPYIVRSSREDLTDAVRSCFPGLEPRGAFENPGREKFTGCQRENIFHLYTILRERC